MSVLRRWRKEPGVRLQGSRSLDRLKVQVPCVVRVPTGGYRLFYTAVGPAKPYAMCQGYILSAFSDDGLEFRPRCRTCLFEYSFRPSPAATTGVGECTSNRAGRLSSQALFAARCQLTCCTGSLKRAFGWRALVVSEDHAFFCCLTVVVGSTASLQSSAKTRRTTGSVKVWSARFRLIVSTSNSSRDIGCATSRRNVTRPASRQPK